MLLYSTLLSDLREKNKNAYKLLNRYTDQDQITSIHHNIKEMVVYTSISSSWDLQQVFHKFTVKYLNEDIIILRIKHISEGLKQHVLEDNAYDIPKWCENESEKFIFEAVCYYKKQGRYIKISISKDMSVKIKYRNSFIDHSVLKSIFSCLEEGSFDKLTKLRESSIIELETTMFEIDWTSDSWLNIIEKNTLLKSFICLNESKNLDTDNIKRRYKFITNNINQVYRLSISYNKKKKILHMTVYNVPSSKDLEIVLYFLSAFINLYISKRSNIKTTDEEDDNDSSSSYKKNNEIIKKSKLNLLREINPDLFVDSYSREVCMLPTPCEKDTPNSIFYPKNDPKGHFYYIDKEGYYIGFKKSRLTECKYKFILNAYKENQLLKPDSDMCKYYFGSVDNDDTEGRKEEEKNVINNSLSKQSFTSSSSTSVKKLYKNYYKMQFCSFLECIQYIFPNSLSNNDNGGFSTMKEEFTKWGKNIVRQELPFLDEDELEKCIDFIEYQDKCYRFFEQYFNINIVFLESDKKQSLKPIIWNKKEYLWDFNKSNKTIFVIKDINKIYKTTTTSYSLLFYREKCSKNTIIKFLLSDNETKFIFLNEFIEKKKDMSTRNSLPNGLNTKSISSQYVDYNGKCIHVKYTEDNDKDIIYPCYMAPTSNKVIKKEDMLESFALKYLNISYHHSSTNSTFYSKDF